MAERTEERKEEGDSLFKTHSRIWSTNKNPTKDTNKTTTATAKQLMKQNQQKIRSW